MKKLLLAALAGTFLVPVAQAANADLDAKYGIANRPGYIKHYEVNKQGELMLNPFLQVGSKEFRAMLDPRRPVYNYVVTEDGKIAFIEEAPHPYGRTYNYKWYRPEDKSMRKKGSNEKYGHTSAVGGGPGRISGEVINTGKCWMVNNKSGRYSKRNHDRTPQQFWNAFQLMKQVADPNGMPFCEYGTYLLAYAPEYIAEPLRKSPQMVYEKPETKKNAHIRLYTEKDVPQFKIPEYKHMPVVAWTADGQAAPAAAKAPKVEKKKKEVKVEKFPTEKGKNAYNDDPS